MNYRSIFRFPLAAALATALLLSACGGDNGSGGDYAAQLRGVAVPASAGPATPVPQPTTAPEPTPAPPPTAAVVPTAMALQLPPLPTAELVQQTLLAEPQVVPTAWVVIVTATRNLQANTIVNDLLTGGVEPCYMGADGSLRNAEGDVCSWGTRAREVRP